MTMLRLSSVAQQILFERTICHKAVHTSSENDWWFLMITCRALLASQPHGTRHINAIAQYKLVL